MKRRNKGFTLVEILAVIVVLGIIMIVALPTYSSIYNSVKLTTYLNTVKTIKTAALDYAGNSYVKDSVKDMHDNAGSANKAWCKTVTIDNLIRAGYLKSDLDEKNAIVDVFTGEDMGYDVFNLDGSVDTSRESTVSLCYCKDNLDIDAFVTKDLYYDQIYHKGEFVRVLKDNKYEYRELKVSFLYNDFALDAYKASKGSKEFTVEGIRINVGNAFDSITDSSRDNIDFLNAVNKLIIENLTLEPTCKR